MRRLAGGGGDITPRLGLEATVQRTATARATSRSEIEPTTAAARRAALCAPARTRALGRGRFYGWSEDKARQYAEPIRTDFGAFVRARDSGWSDINGTNNDR